MCIVTIVIVAPAPLVQVAMIAARAKVRLLHFPVADPAHYLRCCSERMRAAAPDPECAPSA